jgi:hypothetical protein
MTCYRWVGTHPYRDHRNDRTLDHGDTFDSDRIAAAHPRSVERVETDADSADADETADDADDDVPSLADHTKAALYDRATEAGIEGRSSMSKAELIDALREHEGET